MSPSLFLGSHLGGGAYAPVHGRVQAEPDWPHISSGPARVESLSVEVVRSEADECTTHPTLNVSLIYSCPLILLILPALV